MWQALQRECLESGPRTGERLLSILIRQIEEHVWY
jgi:hypothetical protein